jgi:hypothetical protein
MKLKIIITVAIVTIFTGCNKKDFDYNYPIPKIIFDGNVNSRNGVPTGEIKVRYTLQAVSELVSLKITQSINNGTATDVANISTFADPLLESRVLNYTVPASATAGQQVKLFFLLTDKRNKISDTATYTINVVGAQFLQSNQTICGNLVTVIEPPIGNTTAIINLNDFTFAAGRKYLLKNRVTFEEGNNVIFEPGTIIYGNATPLTQIGATVLVIPSGVTVQANGTKDNPIVLTSSNVICGTPQAGDWQGLDFQGSFSTSPTLSSGTIRYLRCEYGGRDNIDNGSTGNIRLSNLANTTTIEYIQSFKSFGNAIRLNGGNVNLRYAVSTDQLDNGFRLDDFQLPSGASIAGWNGNGQFWISVNNLSRDNSELEIRDNANPRLCNITMIGRSGTATGPDDGIRIRNTALGYRIFNMILTSIPDDGVRGELPNPSSNLMGDRVIGHSAFYGIRDQALRDNASTFSGATYNNSFANIAGVTTNSFVPNALPTSAYNATSLGTWFMSAAYVGAIGTIDWTSDGTWCKNADGTTR